MSEYTPQDWYWFKGTDLQNVTSVYSSRRMLEVQPDDADYLAFLAAGNVPTRYPASDDELRDVLRPYNLFLTQAEADAYAAKVVDKSTLVAGYQQIGTDLANIRTQAATLKAGKQALIDVADDIIANASSGNAVAKLKNLAGAFKQLVNGVDTIVDGVDKLAEDGEKARKGLKIILGAP